MTAYYDAALKDCGMTEAQYYLLVNLKRLEKANITRWSGWVGLYRSTLTRNIHVLEEKEFVEQVPGHVEGLPALREGAGGCGESTDRVDGGPGAG